MRYIATFSFEMGDFKFVFFLFISFFFYHLVFFPLRKNGGIYTNIQKKTHHNSTNNRQISKQFRETNENPKNKKQTKGGRREVQMSPVSLPPPLSPLHPGAYNVSMSPLPTPPPSPPAIPPLPRDYAEFELSLQTLMRQTALLAKPTPST